MIAECRQCGQPLLDDTEYCPQCKTKNPNSKVGTFGQVPAWGWIFVAGCGAIPLVTLGGAIPVVIGLGAAGACASIAKRPDWTIIGRVAACGAITTAAWIALLIFLILAGKISS